MTVPISCDGERSDGGRASPEIVTAGVTAPVSGAVAVPVRGCAPPLRDLRQANDGDATAGDVLLKHVSPEGALSAQSRVRRVPARKVLR